LADGDVAEIVRLIHDYAFYNDTFEVDRLVDLFVEDAWFDMRPSGLDRYDGREAIRDFFEREKRALSHVVHLTSNHRIDVDGDEAAGTAYYHAVGVTRRGGHENGTFGYYRDSYRRTPEGWRFASRSSNPLLPWTPITKGTTG
jgi:ketosteroid isomerase-like protein